MKAQSPRELIAQAVIVLAVCVGGWLMLVKPKIDELARLDHQTAEHPASPNGPVNQQTIEQAARRLGEIKEQVRAIHAFNTLADDSSRLYGIVMDLADTHRVVVHNLQPGAAKQTEADGKVMLTRITLTAEGEYANVASFLGAVCDVEAFIRPISLQLDPAQQSDGATVEATLTCDVLSFPMEGTLTELLACAASGDSAQPSVTQSAMGGGTHAQP